MRLNAFLKILCFLASVSNVIWAAGLENKITHIKLDFKEQNRLPFYVPDSDLWGLKNFDRKYLTLRTPGTREEANEFSVRINSFMNSIRKLIWDLDGCYDIIGMREYFIRLMEKHQDLKCQSTRRSLIYGVLYRF